MKNILVIDTDIDHLTVVELILSSNGYKVHSHSKWSEGFIYLEVGNPSLIIMEVFLDTADGRNLAKQIKEKEKTKDIPIILLSTDPKVKDSIKECQVDEFILKPIEIDHFVRTIQKLIAA